MFTPLKIGILNTYYYIQYMLLLCLYFSRRPKSARKPHKTPKESRYHGRRKEEFWYRFFASIPNLRDHNYRSVCLVDRPPVLLQCKIYPTFGIEDLKSPSFGEMCFCLLTEKKDLLVKTFADHHISSRR